ncbi:MAG: cell division protein FtsA [Candidatus Cloacimonetes bacterium]|nr:cell division protein FtsA [Candidatus Cloacimonadota bacterium]
MAETIITAINMGSSEISVAIALLNENKKLEIKGKGIVTSDGIEKGIVKDLPLTAESIQKAIKIAEKQSDVEVENIFVGISGQHIICQETVGRISLATDNQPCEINHSHIIAAINDGKNSIKTSANIEKYEILECLPLFYEIDKQDAIKNPIGMSGFSMKVHLKIILADATHIRNIKKCFELAGIKKEPTILLGALATADMVMNDDERKLGCALLDIGEGTTDIVIFQQSLFLSYLCVSMGGGLVSNDLASGLRTPPSSAEIIKIEHGNVLPSTVKAEKQIEVDGIGGRQPIKRPLSWISQIIQIRVKDIIDTCYKDMLAVYPDLDRLNAGLILTGGTAMLENIHLMIEDKNGFNLPCKVAVPDTKGFSGSLQQLDNSRYVQLIAIFSYAIKSGSLEKQPEKKTIMFEQVGSNIKNNILKIFKKINF